MGTQNKDYLVEIHNGLTNSLDQQVAALPKDFNKQRFVQNCMTVLQDGQSDFSKCDSRTVIRTLMKASYLGLDFFNGAITNTIYYTHMNMDLTGVFTK